MASGGLGVIPPLLGPLQNNGGPTFTHALQPGSPALNAGSNDLAVTSTDQRGAGFPRINFSTVDMGAAEYSAPPVIGSFGGAVSYTENAAPTRVATAATVTDSDSPNFFNGRLVARLTANAQSTDRLTIATLGQVSTSGNQVIFAGTTQIGTFSGGAGAAALTIVFNNQANANRVQAVLRNLAYQSISENPSASPRTLSVVLSDGDGGASALTKTINVVPVNDAPVLAPANGGTVGYPQNSAAVQLLGNATVTDPDSANFDGGRLIVRAIAGGNASNRLLIGSGFVFDGTNVKRVSDGLIVGTRNVDGGIGTTRLEITFNANATRAIVQQVVRGIFFRTVNGTSTAQRTIEFSLTDGDGGASNKVNKTVNVSN